MNPEQLKSFEQKIDFIRRTDIGVPRSITIDLAVAANDLPYAITGNLLYMIDAPDADSYIEVRFNKRNQSPIRMYRQMGFITPFDVVYITTPSGQTGNITMIYGGEAPEFLQLIDNRSATSLDMAAIRAELQGDTTPENWGTEKTVGVAAVQILAANANRKGCIIQSKGINGGQIYIGFDNTVTSSKWVVQLTGGMSVLFDDYRGDLYAIADTAGQLVGWGEW